MRLAPQIAYLFPLLLCLTMIIGVVVDKVSRIEDVLLPAEQSIYPWRTFASTDSSHGGSSSVDLREDSYTLNFDFKLSPNTQYPYATLGLIFDTPEEPDKLLDWSHYASVNLRVKCRPNNVLSFVLHSYEDNLTRLPDISSFRPSIVFFDCAETWQEIQINLHQLDTPEWWLRQSNLTLASQNYALNKVRGFSIASSVQSPVESLASVSIASISLQGRKWPVIYCAIIAIACIWLSFAIIYFRRAYTQRTQQPPAPSSPSAPTSDKEPLYQPVDTQSKREREKSAVLQYLAVEYVNPDLSVDTMVAALGINRSKINDILRDEVGLTFSAYLNKLRLTEAARLLSEVQMGVAETAYAVGYGNVSYFNRVFKKTYGCTPSTYKTPEP